MITNIVFKTVDTIQTKIRSNKNISKNNLSFSLFENANFVVLFTPIQPFS